MASPSSFLLPPLPLLLLTSLFLPLASCSTHFSFPSFSPNDPLISVSNGTTISGGSLRLTDGRAGDATASGRAYYAQPVKLWRFGTNATTNFTTYFEFVISFANGSAAANSSSGGFIFFLAPPDASSSAAGFSVSNSTAAGRQNVTRRLLAIEFDSFRDNQTSNITTGAAGDTLAALITYSGSSNSLSVNVRKPQATGNSSSLSLSHVVDLKTVLPEEVLVGFSVSNGSNAVVQRITKWNFTSTMDDFSVGGGSRALKPWLLGPVAAVALLAAVAAVSACYFCGGEELKMRILRVVLSPLVCCNLAARTRLRLGEPMDDEFDQGAGPRRFSYKLLASATGNFSEKRKLGEGGFGGVYRGVLNRQDVAVKKISSKSKQGRKEYASEVKIISRLRHRNLVQLIGWCHERNEFLLVYEFLPNGSLDQHLFDRSSSLPWRTRYNIALGLASALMYLHEEWEQCVVHRDVKSSNVMLDSDFNAKLGDFGLARLVDHKLGQQTTLPAGTLGYLAPECFTTAKASKESDVFSFGIVALEIATGRRAIEHSAEEFEMRLAQKVWELNGRGRLLDAADPSLSLDADDRKEMECLLLVGLWCAHPDQGQRPAIRQVIKALTFEGSLPDVPRTMPVPVFAEPPLLVQPEEGTNSTPPSITFSSFVTGR